MKTSLILILLLCITFSSTGQAIPTSKAAYYNWIYLNNSSRVLKGVILATNDSSVQFIHKAFLTRGKVMASYQLQVIPISTIKSIKYRESNSRTKGALLGAAGGAATGALIGYASGDDECQSAGGWLDCMFIYTAEEKAGIGAILGIIPGMGIGLLLGSSRKTIHINGDQQMYTLTRDELKKYTLSAR